MIKKIMLFLLIGLSNMSLATTSKAVLFLTSSEASVVVLHKNNYILTLTNPPEYVTYYTAIPNPLAKIVNLTDFTSLWSNRALKDNFINHPPCALLIAVSATGEQQIKAIITNPSMVQNTLSYQISVIDAKPLHVEKFKYLMIIFDNVPDTIRNF